MIKNVSLIICLGDLDLTKPKQLTITQTVWTVTRNSFSMGADSKQRDKIKVIITLLIFIVWQNIKLKLDTCVYESSWFEDNDANVYLKFDNTNNLPNLKQEKVTETLNNKHI